MRRPHLLNCLLPLSVALWCASCGRTLPGQPHPVGKTCESVQGEGQPLQFEDGTQAYIAPGTLAISGGRYFLAGTPNYVFGPGPGGQPTLLGRDSIMGAIISGETSHAVPSPLAVRLATLVRAAGRTDGGWDVVFGERDAPALDGPEASPGRVVRLWYGVYKEGRWHSLEQLPLPKDTEVASTGATGVSELASNGRRLAWAVAVKTAGSALDQVVVFERTDNQWIGETVHTETGAYLSLSYQDTSASLLLAAVKPDGGSLRPGESDGNSLFLWTRTGDWNEPRRIVLGGKEGRVHRPLLTASRQTTLTWAAQAAAGYELRAMNVLTSDSVFTITSKLANIRGYAVLSLGDSVVWVSLDPPPADSIRMYGLSPAGLKSYGAVRNPFFATFRAAEGPQAGQIILMGGVGVPERNMVQTLVTIIHLDCLEHPHRR